MTHGQIRKEYFRADYRGTQVPEGLRLYTKSLHLMREHLFLESLADIILCHVNSSDYPTMERDIVDNGNFERRVFSSNRLFRMLTKNWIRFMMNMAMVMKERDFQQMWQQLGDRIQQAAEDYESDMINQEHKTMKP